jgi:MFS family permease
MKGALASTARAYTELLGIRRARGFVIAGIVGRFPISMRSLAVLLMVLATSHSYKLAGAVSATVALTSAAAVPALGRLADRRGQSWLLFSALGVHVSGIAVLILATQLRAPVWTYFAGAVLFGGSALPFGSLVRARWAALLHGTPRLTTAYAFEAFVDDVIYVTGPIIVTFLATDLFPAAALLAVLAFVLVGWVSLALQRGTQPEPASRQETPPKTAISEPGMRALVLVCLAMGSWFGASNVALVAFAEERGNPGMGGVLIGATVLGGMIAGLVYGGISWRSGLVPRVFVTGCVLGLGSLLLLIPDSIAWMAPFALVAGIGITPTLIGIYSLLSNVVSKRAVTEGFAWIASSITVGNSAGTATTGYLVDHSGSFGALVFLAGSGLALPVVVIASSRLLSREPRSTAAPAK